MAPAGRSRFLGALVFAVALAAATPASAGLFDFLFGGGSSSRPVPAPAPAPTPDKPAAEAPQDSSRAPRIAGGLGSPASYCVRMCDGRYFPIQRSATAQATQVCSALCPAAATKVFYGTDVARAAAGDGSRYEDLENAFVYRERTVDNCTCNGRTPYGLATLDARNDPTLRPGDLIATNEGLVRATTAQAAVGQANSDDVTSSLGLRGQLDAPPEPQQTRRRSTARSNFYSRQNTWR